MREVSRRSETDLKLAVSNCDSASRALPYWPDCFASRSVAMLERENPAPRVAPVSGAGRGIGAAIAGQLAKEGIAFGVLDIKSELARAVTASIVSSGC
jgi:hypothetical protein